MKHQNRALMAIILSLLLLAGPWGCAGMFPTLPSPPSEETRARLGTVGVVAARCVPGVEFTLPEGRLEGAAEGAAIGFSMTLEAGAQTGNEYGMLLALILSPAATVAGGVVGAVRALPVEDVEAWRRDCARVLSELGVQETVRDQFVEAAARLTEYQVEKLEEGGPVTLGEGTSYLALEAAGIDTVIELSVLRVGLGLWDQRGINAPVSMSMTLQTRLVRTSDDKVLHENILRYESVERLFSVWAADNARMFREEFDRAFHTLVERDVEELFLLYIPGRSASRL